MISMKSKANQQAPRMSSDTSPELGGDLDVAGKKIYSSSGDMLIGNENGAMALSSIDFSINTIGFPHEPGSEGEYLVLNSSGNLVFGDPMANEPSVGNSVMDNADVSYRLLDENIVHDFIQGTYTAMSRFLYSDEGYYLNSKADGAGTLIDWDAFDGKEVTITLDGNEPIVAVLTVHNSGSTGSYALVTWEGYTEATSTLSISLGYKEIADREALVFDVAEGKFIPTAVALQSDLDGLSPTFILEDADDVARNNVTSELPTALYAPANLAMGGFTCEYVTLGPGDSIKFKVKGLAKATLYLMADNEGASAMQVSYYGAGVQVRLTPTNGYSIVFTLNDASVNIFDGAEHEILLELASGMRKVYVDGNLVNTDTNVNFNDEVRFNVVSALNTEGVGVFGSGAIYGIAVPGKVEWKLLSDKADELNLDDYIGDNSLVPVNAIDTVTSAHTFLAVESGKYVSSEIAPLAAGEALVYDVDAGAFKPKTVALLSDLDEYGKTDILNPNVYQGSDGIKNFTDCLYSVAGDTDFTFEIDLLIPSGTTYRNIFTLGGSDATKNGGIKAYKTNSASNWILSTNDDGTADGFNTSILPANDAIVDERIRLTLVLSGGILSMWINGARLYSSVSHGLPDSPLDDASLTLFGHNDGSVISGNGTGIIVYGYRYTTSALYEVGSVSILPIPIVGVDEAPINGKDHVRNNGNWKELEDAPSGAIVDSTDVELNFDPNTVNPNGYSWASSNGSYSAPGGLSYNLSYQVAVDDLDASNNPVDADLLNGEEFWVYENGTLIPYLQVVTAANKNGFLTLGWSGLDAINITSLRIVPASAAYNPLVHGEALVFDAERGKFVPMAVALKTDLDSMPNVMDSLSGGGAITSPNTELLDSETYFLPLASSVAKGHFITVTLSQTNSAETPTVITSDDDTITTSEGTNTEVIFDDGFTNLRVISDGVSSWRV